MESCDAGGIIARPARTHQQPITCIFDSTRSYNHAKRNRNIIEFDFCLTTASPEGLTLHSKTKILEPRTWTVPTIVGKTMYIRDNKSILALDLG